MAIDMLDRDGYALPREAVVLGLAGKFTTESIEVEALENSGGAWSLVRPEAHRQWSPTPKIEQGGRSRYTEVARLRKRSACASR